MSNPPMPRAGTTRFALSNAARIAFDPGSIPEADAGAPALLLLHDLLADRGAFAAQRATFGGAHRVILPDARGHGASASLVNQWYTVAALAADATAVLDAEGVPAVHLVGHGLGGATALELARRFPERVHSLVLIEPALYGLLDNDPEPAVVGLRNERRATDRSAADLAYKGQVDASLDTYLTPRWGHDWRQQATKPRQGAIRRHAAALSGLLPALDAYTLTRPDARRLTTPTLIVHGADAMPIDRVLAARLADLLPAARAIAVPLAAGAHGPLAGTAAPLLNDAIADFLAANP